MLIVAAPTEAFVDNGDVVPLTALRLVTGDAVSESKRVSRMLATGAIFAFKRGDRRTNGEFFVFIILDCHVAEPVTVRHSSYHVPYGAIEQINPLVVL